MNLPDNVAQLARSFPGLDQRRKDEIIRSLAAVPEDARNYGIETFINRRPPREAAFVMHLLGKEAPATGASPENKALGAPMRK
jgi:hypothetical protein